MGLVVNLRDDRTLPVATPTLVQPTREEVAEFRASGRLRTALFTGYRPHAKQIDLHKSCARYLAIVAGRRSGKTYAGAREFMRRVFRDFAAWRARGGEWWEPGNLSELGGEFKAALTYWVVAPTYQLGHLQRQEVFEILGGFDSPLILKYQRSENRLWLVGGVKIEFRSADRPQFLVGDDVNGVWMDEAARIKAEAWLDNIAPALWGTGGWAIFTTTPLGHNWFYEEIWQRTPHGLDPRGRSKDYAGFHFTTRDNTRVPALVAEAERAERNLPRAIYLRNYEASFDAFVGQIFPMFTNDETHVIQAIPWNRLVKRWGAIDWGTGNPGAHLELARDDRGKLYVLREDYQRDLPLKPPTHALSADSWLNRILAAERRGAEYWWADPSGRGQIRQLTDEGLDVRAALNDVHAGIAAVATMLTPAAAETGGTPEPSLYIHAGCANLRRELASYRWDESGEKPVKERDHSVDALRYGIYTEHMRGGGGFEQLNFSIFRDAA